MAKGEIDRGTDPLSDVVDVPGEQLLWSQHSF
jgi:hypothetical protein